MIGIYLAGLKTATALAIFHQRSAALQEQTLPVEGCLQTSWLVGVLRSTISHLVVCLRLTLPVAAFLPQTFQEGFPRIRSNRSDYRRPTTPQQN